MEICVLNPYFYPYKGGTEKVLLEVYSRLAKRHNITILTSTVPGRNEKRTEEIRGITVIRLKTKQYALPGLPLPFESFKDLNTEIKKAEADLYHINNRYQYFYFNLNNIKSSGKLCLTVHNSLPKNINIPTDIVGLAYDVVWGRRIMHQADLITGVSKNAIDCTIPNRDKHKAHVIYNGVDSTVFKKYPRDHPKVEKILDELSFTGPTVLCNGRLVPQKGQRYLMHALSLISEGGNMPNLLLVGKGPMEHTLRHTADRLGINIQIRYDLGEDKLPYYYSASDISVVPSLYEPASLAALESMSCELPVIASRTGGLPEMVGQCGIYTEPKDSRSMANALSGVLLDLKKAAAMGRAGRKHVIKMHSWDKIAKKYEELFLNTVKQ
jgi:glycosyltransferase involved in cell wall biosynthesis